MDKDAWKIVHQKLPPTRDLAQPAMRHWNHPTRTGMALVLVLLSTISLLGLFIHGAPAPSPTPSLSPEASVPCCTFRRLAPPHSYRPKPGSTRNGAHSGAVGSSPRALLMIGLPVQC